MSLAEDVMLAKQLREKLRSLDESISRRANHSPITAEDERSMVAMQSRADAAYQADGRRAPEYLPLERPSEYRRRLVAGLQIHSPRWQKADFRIVHDDAMPIAEEQVYADALKNARTSGLAVHQLRPIEGTTAAGHHQVEWAGGPEASFVNQFRRPARRAKFKSAEEYTRMSRDSQMAKIGQIVHEYRPAMAASRAGF